METIAEPVVKLTFKEVIDSARKQTRTLKDQQEQKIGPHHRQD
jgi:hypothetical protein